MNHKKNTVFFTEDYRVILKNRQKQLKNSLGKMYNLASFADAIHVQRTYLSKVFSGGADLNSDQLYLAKNFLEFNQLECKYIETLHELQRSHVSQRQTQLKFELDTIRESAFNNEPFLKSEILHDPENEPLNMQAYFLNPQVQLTHMFLTSHAYKSNHKEIQKALNINDESWKLILKELIGLNLITIDGGNIKVKKEHVLLQKESPLFSAYHTMIKSFAINRLNNLPNSSKTSFSTLFTCSKKTAEKIKVELREFIKSMEEMVISDNHPSKVHQFSVDLFPWD